jgi:hypothetical protein
MQSKIIIGRRNNMLFFNVLYQTIDVMMIWVIQSKFFSLYAKVTFLKYVKVFSILTLLQITLVHTLA